MTFCWSGKSHTQLSKTLLNKFQHKRSWTHFHTKISLCEKAHCSVKLNDRAAARTINFANSALTKKNEDKNERMRFLWNSRVNPLQLHLANRGKPWKSSFMILPVSCFVLPYFVFVFVCKFNSSHFCCTKFLCSNFVFVMT